MSERDPVSEQPDVAELLEEWREAERDAEAEAPDSPARTMARKRADAARDGFHDAEDEEHRRLGDDSPRTHRDGASD